MYLYSSMCNALVVVSHYWHHNMFWHLCNIYKYVERILKITYRTHLLNSDVRVVRATVTSYPIRCLPKQEVKQLLDCSIDATCLYKLYSLFILCNVFIVCLWSIVFVAWFLLLIWCLSFVYSIYSLIDLH